MIRTRARLLLLATLGLGCGEHTLPPSEAARAEPPTSSLWSSDCASWAGMPLPLPALGGALEDSDCAPGSPPAGAAGRAVNVGHVGVTDADALHAKYLALAVAAGWTPRSPPTKIPSFTHAAHPGFVLTLDRHFAREEGWYTGVFSARPQR